MASAEQGTINVIGAAVPVRMTALSERIVRLSIGDRAAGASTSYLHGQQEAFTPPSSLKAIDGGFATAAFSIAPNADGALVLRNSKGRSLLHLVLDRITLTPAVGLRLLMQGEQHLYGMGEGGQQFDRLGVARRLWNFQANRGQGADMAVPLFLSQVGYGLFIDNTSRGQLQHGDSNEGGTIVEYVAEAGPFDLYLFAGDMRTMLGDVAALLGRATLPPRWSLGYLQSTRHFTGIEEIIDLGVQMRERRLPCDAIIFLSTYGRARGLNRGVGHLEYQPELFADPKSVLGKLHAMHLRTFSHEYPVLHEDSPLYREANERGYLLSHAYPRLPPPTPDAAVFKEGQRFIDFSNPEARAWWWSAHRELVSHDTSGWWLDGGEGPPPGTALKAGDAANVHNHFDLWRQQAFAEGEARDRPDQRPFLLCRSGGPGMQRFGAIPWSGDVNTTFETFETQIRTGLNLGLSGIPHWGTDAGGFYSVAPDAGELFVRWLQFAAFCTLFRAHGHVWRRHVPWAHGPEIEAIVRDIIELRYRMMPTTYTLMWQARQTGLPTMRALVLNYPDDANVWDLGTEYLWGDDLLVAPVTRRGATHWPVYLPAGTWHHYWTHETYHGPAGITVESPLERLPLFVRAGAILAFGPVSQYDGERPADEITLLTYPDGNSTFTLYEDDGISNAYLKGGHATTRFDCTADQAGVKFQVHAPQGDASVIPEGRIYTLQIRSSRTPRSVSVDGAALERRRTGGPAWWHDDDRFLFVLLPRGPSTVQIVW
jgi:alpha-glucosidase (family GH31 glycosyl hydrolase)